MRQRRSSASVPGLRVMLRRSCPLTSSHRSIYPGRLRRHLTRTLSRFTGRGLRRPVEFKRNPHDEPARHFRGSERVVIPLTKSPSLIKRRVSHLTPKISFEGDEYVLMTPQLAGISRTELGALTGSLTGDRQAIVAAVDFG